MSAMAAVGGLLPSAEAALEVDFITTRGTITAVMEYGKAPKAVASLTSLAEGSRNWVDPGTGQVRRTRFFNGLPFHQVVNSAAVKTIETGSPLGSGTDVPGYTFPDEIDASLTHTSYVLSMSNHGPNTNGACFVFTGNVSMPSRDGRNTVFGKVDDPASRSVIDAALSAGAGATMIVDVQVRRTDPQALAFDESSVGLPTVWPVSAPLRVMPGSKVEWLGEQPGFSVVRAHQSTDLIDWSPHFRHMVGLDDPLPGVGLDIDAADVPARFYYFSLATYPDAGGVTGFANRRLTIESPGFGTMIYQFNSEGDGGAYENILFPGDPPQFSGLFVVSQEIPTVFEPYSFKMLLELEGLGGARFNLIEGGLDVVQPGSVSGRHVTQFLSSSLGLVFEDIGSLELSRP